MPTVTKQVPRKKVLAKKSPAKKTAKTKKLPARRVQRRPASIADLVTDIDSFEEEGIKISLYGKSGTGKTTLWATFPKPILVMIRSGGAKPGELRSINTPEYRRTIKQIPLTESCQVGQVCEAVADGNLRHPKLGPYKTVVLDHGTGLQQLILMEILGLEKIPEQLSWGLASQQQYGQAALQIKERMRQMLDLSCNVVIVAQERAFNVDEEQEGLFPYVASDLFPSVVRWLNPACDYLCETFIRQKVQIKKIKIGKQTTEKAVKMKGVDYCLRTAPHEVYMTKFRVPKGTPLPEEIVDPSYDKIMELIQGA